VPSASAEEESAATTGVASTTGATAAALEGAAADLEEEDAAGAVLGALEAVVAEEATGVAEAGVEGAVLAICSCYTYLCKVFLSQFLMHNLFYFNINNTTYVFVYFSYFYITKLLHTTKAAHFVHLD
jgi:hypothetical protein